MSDRKRMSIGAVTTPILGSRSSATTEREVQIREGTATSHCITLLALHFFLKTWKPFRGKFLNRWTLSPCGHFNVKQNAKRKAYFETFSLSLSRLALLRWVAAGVWWRSGIHLLCRGIGITSWTGDTKMHAPKNRNSPGTLLEPFAVGLQSWANYWFNMDCLLLASLCISLLAHYGSIHFKPFLTQSGTLKVWNHGREWMQDLIKIKLCFNASWSVCVSRSMVHGSTRELILYLWSLEQYLLRELNLELILFILALILPALSSLFFSTLLVFILPSSFQLFFFLLYLLHPSDSFPFSSLLFSCSLFKCTCPKFNCNSWYRISFEGITSWVNSVHIGSDTSCSFFPLLLYSACIYSSLFFSTLFFSFTFSILLILSLSLLYSFHVVSLSALARSLTVIVDIGSLLRELNLELILFILALILPALSSLFLYSACIYSSLFFSTLFFSFTFSILLILSLSLLYSFHVVSLSALARSLTVIVDIGSLLRELNLELILFILALILPALSSVFFSTLLVFILPSSFQLFFSPLPSPSFWFFPFLFSTLFM